MLINPQRGNTRGVGLTDVGIPVQNLDQWYVLADTDGRTMTLLPFRSDGTQGPVITCTANDPAALLKDSLGVDEWDDQYVGALVLTISGGAIYAAPTDLAADLTAIDENRVAVGGWIGRSRGGSGTVGGAEGGGPTAGTTETKAVSNTPLRVFGSSNWSGTSATAHSVRSRSVLLSNNDPSNTVYVARAGSGTGANALVSTSDFSFTLAPGAATEIIVLPGQDLFVVKATTSSATLRAEEVLL